MGIYTSHLAHYLTKGFHSLMDQNIIIFNNQSFYSFNQSRIMVHSLGPNTAAVLPARQGLLTVQERPVPTPGQGELLVRNEAVAANPADWKIQSLGINIDKFPAILGSDLSGTVVSVGPSVTRFQAGDRVMGFALGMVTGNNDASALQTYTLLNETATSHLPKNLTFEQGAVLPVGMTTASIALFADL